MPPDDSRPGADDAGSPGAAPRRAFPCTRCGACCRHVDLAQETRHLDRGDGACRHYDDSTKACRTYASRPMVCRVDQYYEANYVRVYEWEAFVEMNLRACRHLAALDAPDEAAPPSAHP